MAGPLLGIPALLQAGSTLVVGGAAAYKQKKH